MELYYEADTIERNEFLRGEYPFMGIQEPGIPRQILCDRCTTDPQVEVSQGVFGVIVRKLDVVHIPEIEDEEEEKDTVWLKFKRWIKSYGNS